MKCKRVLAALLCVSMFGSMLTGCNIGKQENEAKAESTISGSSVHEEVNLEDESKVNYDTNFISGNEGTSVTDALQKNEAEDIVSALISTNSKKEEKPVDVVEEKQPDASRDESGDLTEPFDKAYPDIFNSGEVEYADNAILIKVKNAYSDETVEGLKAAGIGKMETIFTVDKYTWYTSNNDKYSAINDRLNLTEEQFAKADLDGSGVLEAFEALRIIQYVNGTITSVLF